jgi:hypothetical protein
MLQASGKHFSSSQFLQAHSIPGAEARGDTLVVVGSTRDGLDFSGQVQDAELFLAANSSALENLVSASGADLVYLDFGVWLKDTASQSYRFPPPLVVAAGGLGIALEVSLYAAADS